MRSKPQLHVAFESDFTSISLPFHFDDFPPRCHLSCASLCTPHLVPTFAHVTFSPSGRRRQAAYAAVIVAVVNSAALPDSQKAAASYQAPIVQQHTTVIEQPGARITQTNYAQTNFGQTNFAPSNFAAAPGPVAPVGGRLVKVSGWRANR